MIFMDMNFCLSKTTLTSPISNGSYRRSREAHPDASPYALRIALRIDLGRSRGRLPDFRCRHHDHDSAHGRSTGRFRGRVRLHGHAMVDGRAGTGDRMISVVGIPSQNAQEYHSCDILT